MLRGWQACMCINKLYISLCSDHNPNDLIIHTFSKSDGQHFHACILFVHDGNQPYLPINLAPQRVKNGFLVIGWQTGPKVGPKWVLGSFLSQNRCLDPLLRPFPVPLTLKPMLDPALCQTGSLANLAPQFPPPCCALKQQFAKPTHCKSPDLAPRGHCLWKSSMSRRLLVCNVRGQKKRGHYERGLFIGRISQNL